MIMRTPKFTRYRHRGYAFDGAAGHDVLVTDNLKRRFRYAFDRQFAAKMAPFAMNKWSDGNSVNLRS